ncbi:MAG TPA: heavy metal translocating P-type ATPase [Kiritimatiellia bacterium]|nr:heavy metal translocating P-type ATPase [Kiritimatiellia bacterium]
MHAKPWVRVETLASDGTAHHPWKLPLGLAALCGALTLAGFLIEKTSGMRATALACYLAAYLAGAWFAVQETWELLRKRVLDVHFLMIAVAAGAASIGHWWEGAVLLFLFSLSDALEDLAQQRTERAIDSLFKEAPKQATVLDPDGTEREWPVDQLAPGMRIAVRPGAMFPVDARVLHGESAADESNLTGESLPIDKIPGETVRAGTLNLWGRLDCEVLKPADQSALAKIIHLIQQARESKAPTQRFTDKFGSGYTYSVLMVCGIMFLVWWKIAGLPADQAFYRTMTLLVVSSPCALVLSIPSAVLAGIAAAARRGILFRGGIALEKLAEIRRVALDKTGTLTTGSLRVVAIEPEPGVDSMDLVLHAGALATHSSHPVSHAVARHAFNLKKSMPVSAEFRSHAGSGVSGRIAGRLARFGRRNFLSDATWAEERPLPSSGVTEAFYDDGLVRGRLLLQDEVRAASRPLLDRLRRRGLRVTMLTGDRAEAAGTVAQAVGLTEIEHGLTPDEKVARVKAWAEAGERPAMVGDGVNDAPSLAAAHVGVAMGLRGSDAALEQADVILMQDRLDRFIVAYEISRRARAIIRQNLAISLGSVTLLAAAAFGGWIPLTVGVIGHEGSTVLVVLNSLRLLVARFEEDSEEN